MENFGEVIKRKREARGWTQKQLAELLHVSPKSVSRWETGNGYPDIALLPELAKVLELDYRELLDGNAYIARKRDIRKKKLRILILGIITVIAISGLLIVSLCNKGEEYTIRELLVDEQWSYIYFDSDSSWYLLEEDQKDNVLEYLHFDEWEEVIMREKDKSGFIFNTLGDIHWYMLFKVGEEQFQIRYQEYQEEYYISIEKADGYEIYKVNQPLESPEAYIQEDMKQWYGFSNQHIIKNKSQDIKELSIEDCEMLLLEYTLDKGELLYNDYIFIEDQHNNRYYFILTSNKKDYQTIYAEIDNGNIDIQLTGEEKAYQNQYVHIFKIDEMCGNISIKYNNEDIDIIDLLHTSYEAKEVNIQ